MTADNAQVLSRDHRMDAYLSMARGTGVFTPDEIEILREVLDDAWTNPESTYLVYERQAQAGSETVPAGFIIFGRTPMTAFSWDMYWIVVDRGLQGKGIGRRLLELMEETLRVQEPKSIIRVETSGKEVYNATRSFYDGTGFTLLGAIPEFYEPGDDLLIYYKIITR